MIITNFHITDPVIANGMDQIRASAVINTNDGAFASGISVTFSVDGDATFLNGNSSVTAISDPFGNVSAGFIDKKVEKVTISISITDEPETNQSKVAEFLSPDNNVDTIKLQVTTDNAQADGKSRNTIKLETFSGNIPVGHASLELYLTNGAVFINGESLINIETDGSGQSSVDFTNNNEGEVTLRAYLKNNCSVNSFISCRFSAVEQYITLTIIKDNAVANGKDFNEVRAQIIENSKPKPGALVEFIAYGNALFENNLSNYSHITDSEGYLSAKVKDMRTERVQITALAAEHQASVALTFRQGNTQKTHKNSDFKISFLDEE